MAPTAAHTHCSPVLPLPPRQWAGLLPACWACGATPSPGSQHPGPAQQSSVGCGKLDAWVGGEASAQPRAPVLLRAGCGAPHSTATPLLPPDYRETPLPPPPSPRHATEDPLACVYKNKRRSGPEAGGGRRFWSKAEAIVWPLRPKTAGGWGTSEARVQAGPSQCMLSICPL